MTGSGDGLDVDEEVDRLGRVAEDYDLSDSRREFDYRLKRFEAQAIRSWLSGERVLEMGCATGELAALLIGHCARYEVVEGAQKYLEAIRRRLPEVTTHLALWEEFEPDGGYTDILLNCGLEHVLDPVGVLTRAAGWLSPRGRLHVMVPNADSLHRYVGVSMGILESRTSLSDADRRIGHRRVYDLDTLVADVRAAGLTVQHWQGIFLKLLSNQQMLDWPDELVAAMHDVGRRWPVNCAELYVVATREA